MGRRQWRTALFVAEYDLVKLVATAACALLLGIVIGLAL